jgi:hypothetical protein
MVRRINREGRAVEVDEADNYEIIFIKLILR